MVVWRSDRRVGGFIFFGFLFLCADHISTHMRKSDFGRGVPPHAKIAIFPDALLHAKIGYGPPGKSLSIVVECISNIVVFTRVIIGDRSCS